MDYIGTAQIRAIVARMGPDRFMAELAQEIEADYRRWDEFSKSARHAIHSARGVIELMPISDGRRYTFKYVNGHPQNTASGLLTVTAFGVLADVDSGYPVLLSEMTFGTALRTASVSALAAKLMARPQSRTMAVIGNGAQSEYQVIAFEHMLGVSQVRLYDIDPRATRKLARNLQRLDIPELEVVVCGSCSEAVRGADIVTTVTADKRNALILTPEMIEPGMHLNAVGGDCPGKTELHVDILRRKDARLVVEFEPQARIEGEIQQLEPSEAVLELASVVSGRAPGRAFQEEVTVFDSVGFALSDFATLRYLQKLSREHPGDAEDIDLVPVLADPKDLFGTMIGQARGIRPVRTARPALARD